MDKYVLLIFDRDWADEFQTSGFNVMSEAKWEVFKKQAKEVFDSQEETKVRDYSPPFDENNPIKYKILKPSVEYYFGTNQSHEWATYEDWLKDIKVMPITHALAMTLRSTFKPWMRYGFGIIPYEIGG
jgi:hypothetical protein